MYRTGTRRSGPFKADPTAPILWEDLRRPHHTTSEPAMADGEADTAADASMAFQTSSIKAKPTRMIYRRANMMEAVPRWGTRRSVGSMAAPWPVASRGRWYGIPVHRTMNTKHRKGGELTVSLLKVVTASRTSSRGGSSMAGEKTTMRLGEI